MPHFTLCCIVCLCLIFYSSEDEGSVTGQICVFVNFQDSARVAQKYMLSFGFNLYSFVKETDSWKIEGLCFLFTGNSFLASSRDLVLIACEKIW